MSRYSLGLEPPGWCQPPENDCDGDCSDCRRECEVRGEECRDEDNCRGCTAKGWCDAAINEEDEECT